MYLELQYEMPYLFYANQPSHLSDHVPTLSLIHRNSLYRSIRVSHKAPACLYGVLVARISPAYLYRVLVARISVQHKSEPERPCMFVWCIWLLGYPSFACYGSCPPLFLALSVANSALGMSSVVTKQYKHTSIFTCNVVRCRKLTNYTAFPPGPLKWYCTMSASVRKVTVWIQTKLKR